jgi:hypothetical protein
MNTRLVFLLTVSAVLVALTSCDLTTEDTDPTDNLVIVAEPPAGVTIPSDTAVTIFINDDAGDVSSYGMFPDQWGDEATWSRKINTGDLSMTGTYYVAVLANTDGDIPSGSINSISSWLTVGDYFGYYGGSGTNPPANPNVNLPVTSEQTIEVELALHQ